MKSRKHLAFIDNHNQYLSFIEQFSQENFQIIITGNQFPAEFMLTPEKFNCQLFDELLTPEELREVTRLKDNLIFSWYLDEKGQDVSTHNGYSFGRFVGPSVDILLSTIFKYHACFKRVIQPSDVIYIANDFNKIVLSIVKSFAADGFEFVEFSAVAVEKIIYGKNLELDSLGRVRDQSPFFGDNSWGKILLFWMNLFRTFLLRLIVHKKKVVMIDAGKLDFFYGNLDKFKNLSLSLSFTKDRFLKSKSHIYRFDHHCFFLKKKELQIIRKNLNANLAQKKLIVPSDLISSIFDEYIISYIEGFFHYVAGVEIYFRTLSPDLIVIPSASHETHLIQAAVGRRLNIKIILTSHGAAGGAAYKEYLLGNKSDYAEIWANSKAERDCYLDFGIEEKRLVLFPIPHFFKMYLMGGKLQKSLRNERTKSIILYADYNNTSCSCLIGSPIRIAFEANNVLKARNMEVLGLKTRGSHDKKVISPNSDTLTFHGQQLAIFSNERDQSYFANNVELFVGSYGSSTIEAALLGCDFQVFESKESYQHFASLGVQSKALNCAGDSKSLEENMNKGIGALEKIDYIIEKSTFVDDTYWSKFCELLARK